MRFLFSMITLVLWSVVSSANAKDELRAAPIRLPDLAGKVQEPLKDVGQKATVLFFLCADCPLGNSYAPEIGRIVEEYKAHGVSFYAIYTSETTEEIGRHLKDYKLPMTALADPSIQLAKTTGATVTPEVAVVSPQGVLLYRGRIDDRAVKLGTVKVEPAKRDLRLALDAILQGQPVPVKVTKAIGCYLSLPSSDSR